MNAAKMNGKSFLLVSLITILFLWSCSSHHEEQPPLRKYELADIENKVYSDEIFDIVNTIVPEASDSAALNIIRGIAAIDSIYFILDVKGNIFAFNVNGGFIRKIGDFGNGPGEYSNPRDIDIDPLTGNLAVLDNSNRILLFDTSDGLFSEEIKLGFSAREIEMKKDVIIILRPPCPNGTPTEEEVIILNRETGKESGYLSAFDNCTSLGINISEMSSNESRTFITRKFDNRIYSVTDSIIPMFEIMSNSFVNSFDANKSDLMEFLQNCITNNKVFSIGNFIANDSLLFFKTNIGYGFGHVADKNLKQTKSIKSSEYDITLSNCFIIAGRSNELMFTINPDFILKSLEHNPDNIPLKAMAKSINEDSNLVLLHYKLRSY